MNNDLSNYYLKSSTAEVLQLADSLKKFEDSDDDSDAGDESTKNVLENTNPIVDEAIFFDKSVIALSSECMFLTSCRNFKLEDWTIGAEDKIGNSTMQKVYSLIYLSSNPVVSRAGYIALKYFSFNKFSDWCPNQDHFDASLKSLFPKHLSQSVDSLSDGKIRFTTPCNGDIAHWLESLVLLHSPTTTTLKISTIHNAQEMKTIVQTKLHILYHLFILSVEYNLQRLASEWNRILEDLLLSCVIAERKYVSLRSRSLPSSSSSSSSSSTSTSCALSGCHNMIAKLILKCDCDLHPEYTYESNTRTEAETDVSTISDLFPHTKLCLFSLCLIMDSVNDRSYGSLSLSRENAIVGVNGHSVAIEEQDYSELVASLRYHCYINMLSSRKLHSFLDVEVNRYSSTVSFDDIIPLPWKNIVREVSASKLQNIEEKLDGHAIMQTCCNWLKKIHASQKSYSNVKCIWNDYSVIYFIILTVMRWTHFIMTTSRDCLTSVSAILVGDQSSNTNSCGGDRDTQSKSSSNYACSCEAVYNLCVEWRSFKFYQRSKHEVAVQQIENALNRFYRLLQIMNLDPVPSANTSSVGYESNEQRKRMKL